MSLATTPWILVVIFALCVIDGFFPPLPSESVIIAVVALAAAASDMADLPFVALAAVAGAAVGDTIAYWIGHTIDIRRRISFFTHGAGARAIDWAERTFTQVGGPMIIAGRYVPVGRVAVNMTAGTIRYPYRAFVGWDISACILWAVYTIAIGYGAGSWMHDHPIMGAAAGVVTGIVFGLLLSRVVTWWSARRSATKTGAAVRTAASNLPPAARTRQTAPQAVGEDV